MSHIDTGTIAEEAGAGDRLDADVGEGANALEGGADDELDDVYADPGPVVDEELG